MKETVDTRDSAASQHQIVCVLACESKGEWVHAQVSWYRLAIRAAKLSEM